MQQEKIAILQYLQKSGGLLVVHPADLGLTAKAFAVAVQSLRRNGLIHQDGLALTVLSGTPVTLRLTPGRRPIVEQIEAAKAQAANLA